MSLLNQVLRDLDAQDAPAGTPELKLAQLPPQHDTLALGEEPPKPRWLALAGLSLLALGGAYAIWQWQTPTETAAPVLAADATPVDTQPDEPRLLEETPALTPTDGVVNKGQLLPEQAEMAPPESRPPPSVPRVPRVPAVVGAGAPPVAAPVPVKRKPKPAARPVPVPEPALTKAVLAQSPKPDETSVDYVPLKITPATRVSKPVKRRSAGAGSAIDQVRDAIASGQMSLAEEKLRHLLISYPKDRVANELLVGVLLRGNRPQEVLAQVDKSLGTLGSLPGLELIRARTLLEVGQKAQAEQALQKMLREARPLPDALRLLAGMLQQQGRTDEALPLYQRLTRLPSARAQDWLGLGLASEAKDRRVALAAYRQALSRPGLNRSSRRFVEQRIAQSR